MLILEVRGIYVSEECELNKSNYDITAIRVNADRGKSIFHQYHLVQDGDLKRLNFPRS